MKKLTSALALVAVAASLVACNKPEEKKPEVKVEAPKVVEESKTTTTTTKKHTKKDKKHHQSDSTGSSTGTTDSSGTGTQSDSTTK